MNNLSLQCVIIDDSPTQRLSIANMVQSHPNLNLIKTYPNAILAKQDLIATKIDLVFLDIEMPIISGFDFLEELKAMKNIAQKPQIILIAGKAEHALKAFDYSVTDYLQKPLKKQRFDLAINRAVRTHKEKHGSSKVQPYIIVNSNLQKVKVNLEDIQWIEALGDYIKIITTNTYFLVLSTMKSFITKLPADKFIRVHKSYIVSIDKIDKFSTNNVEICGTQIPLSRSKKNTLEEVLENQF